MNEWLKADFSKHPSIIRSISMCLAFSLTATYKHKIHFITWLKDAIETSKTPICKLIVPQRS